MNPESAPGFDPYAPPQSDIQPDPGLEEASLRPVPFEDWEEMPGFWRRVWATFGLAFTEPMALFDRVPATDGLGAPLRFQFLLASPLILLMSALGVFLVIVAHLGGAQSGEGASPRWLFPAISGFYAVVMPISILVGYFLGGLLLHGLLWVWGGLGSGRGLEQTLRATGYAMAFAHLAALVPCLNYFVPLLLPIPLGLGLARVHRTDAWRGICAAYTPIALALLLVAGIVAVVVAMK